VVFVSNLFCLVTLTKNISLPLRLGHLNWYNILSALNDGADTAETRDYK
jgi:hypothetical protein